MDLATRSFIFLKMLPTMLVDRLHREERGQTAAEYMGVILVIAAIIAILVASDIGNTLVSTIKAAINRVLSEGSP